MEPLCEFCGVARAVVYCKSDSARLCLNCDVSVHSANSLSLRHPVLSYVTSAIPKQQLSTAWMKRCLCVKVVTGTKIGVHCWDIGVSLWIVIRVVPLLLSCLASCPLCLMRLPHVVVWIMVGVPLIHCLIKMTAALASFWSKRNQMTIMMAPLVWWVKSWLKLSHVLNMNLGWNNLHHHSTKSKLHVVHNGSNNFLSTRLKPDRGIITFYWFPFLLSNISFNDNAQFIDMYIVCIFIISQGNQFFNNDRSR